MKTIIISTKPKLTLKLTNDGTWLYFDTSDGSGECLNLSSIVKGDIGRKVLREWCEEAEAYANSQDAVKKEAAPPVSFGASLILAERLRQIWDLKRSAQRDFDAYQGPQLLMAALCYAMQSAPATCGAAHSEIMRHFPWNVGQRWKPSTELRNLVKAGALIAAYIDMQLYKDSLDKVTSAFSDGGNRGRPTQDLFAELIEKITKFVPPAALPGEGNPHWAKAQAIAKECEPAPEKCHGTSTPGAVVAEATFQAAVETATAQKLSSVVLSACMDRINKLRVRLSEEEQAVRMAQASAAAQHAEYKALATEFNDLADYLTSYGTKIAKVVL